MTDLSPTSRYALTEIATFTRDDGTEVRYLRRRFVPPPESFALMHEHTVRDDERLDHIAARTVGDPEQFWRLCDANGVIDPAELTAEAGRRIRITLPEGVPGATE